MFQPAAKTTSIGTPSMVHEQDLMVPFTERKTFATRSISVKGPELWNQHPAHLKSESNHENFKKEHKTFMFTSYIQLTL